MAGDPDSRDWPACSKLWALVGLDDSDLHCIKLVVKRVFYVNRKTAKESATGALYRKVAKTLPRIHPVQNLYKYKVEEAVYQANYNELMNDLSARDRGDLRVEHPARLPGHPRPGLPLRRPEVAPGPAQGTGPGHLQRGLAPVQVAGLDRHVWDNLTVDSGVNIFF